jgi:hypothetical protein
VLEKNCTDRTALQYVVPSSTPHALFPLHTPTVLQTPSSLVTRKINSSVCLSVCLCLAEARNRAETLHSPYLSDKASQTWNFYFEHRKWLRSFQNRRCHLQFRIQERLVRGGVRSAKKLHLRAHSVTAVLTPVFYVTECTICDVAISETVFTARYDSIFKYNPHYCLLPTIHIGETNTWQ